jgi:DNA-binding transcriptional LysR family regulator
VLSVFVRSHHKIDLTPAGEALLPLAHEILDRFDAVPSAVQAVAGSGKRSVVIGIAPDVSPDLRTAVLHAVAADHPGFIVRLEPASTDPLVHSLLANRIDLALVHGPVSAPGVSNVQLETQEVGAVVARGMGFDDHATIRLDELADIPYVSISHDAAPEIYRRIDEALNRAGVHKRITLAGHNFDGLAHVVASGQGFTFAGLGNGATSKAFTGEPVTILAVEGANLSLATVAAWRDGTTRPGEPSGELAATIKALAERLNR